MKIDHLYYMFDGRQFPNKEAAADYVEHYEKMQRWNNENKGWYVENRKQPYSETHDPLGPFATKEEAEKHLGRKI